MPFSVTRVSQVTIKLEIVHLLRKIRFQKDEKTKHRILIRPSRPLESRNPYSGSHKGLFPPPTTWYGSSWGNSCFQAKDVLIPRTIVSLPVYFYGQMYKSRLLISVVKSFDTPASALVHPKEQGYCYGEPWSSEPTIDRKNVYNPS